jgi:hypothetical protein
MEGNVNNKDDNDDVNMTENNVDHNDSVKGGSRQPNATNNDQRLTNNNNNNNNNETETDQIRKFVRSLLGMHLPTTSTSFNHAPTMTTPDPATAAFFAVALLAKTDALSSTTTCNDDDDNNDENNGGEQGSGRQQQYQQHECRWRPDDAYLAARALSL